VHSNVESPSPVLICPKCQDHHALRAQPETIGTQNVAFGNG
jgi:hypothetical protein